MAFGSFVGTVDPSKDYLAAAIGSAGQQLGQGIAGAGQGFAQGMQNKRENDFRDKQLKAQTDANKLSQWNRAVDDLNQEFAPLAKRLDDGTITQQEFDSVYKPRRAQIDSQFAPTALPTDNVNKAIGEPPTQPVPQAAPAPQPIKVDTAAPQDNLAAAFNAPVAQPQAQPQQAPATPAPSLTGLRETAATRAEENKTKEANQKIYQDDIQKIRDAGLTPEVVDDLPAGARTILSQDPELKDPKNAHAVAQYIVRYNKQKDELLRAQATAASGDAGRRATVALLAGGYNTDTRGIDEALGQQLPKLQTTLEALKRDPNNNNAAQAAVKMFIKLYDPGLVTGDEFKMAGNQAGLDFDTIMEKLKKNADGAILSVSSVKEIEKMAQAFKGAYEQALTRTNGRYTRMAAANGIGNTDTFGMKRPEDYVAPGTQPQKPLARRR